MFSEKPKLLQFLLLPLALVVFVVFKIGDLHLPYFWDESAAYMKGVLYMLDNAISLHPSAVPSELSFGHPLILHFILASVAKTFSYSIPLMRGTILLVSILLAIGVFKLSLKLTRNTLSAFFATILLLVQPIFFAQSAMILLEVMLTFFIVFSILFYLQKKHFLSVLMAVGAVLTKETGIVLAIALMCDVVFRFFVHRESKKLFWNLLVYSIPLLVFGSFLLIQKNTFGWYLNPANLGAIKPSLTQMLDRIYFYPFLILFIDQGRFVLSLLLILSLILKLRQHKIKGNWKEFQQFSLITIFIIGFVLFSSIAHNLERYHLVLIPFGVILFGHAIQYFTCWKEGTAWKLLIVACSFSLYSMNKGKAMSDVSLTFRNHIKSNQKLFTYINTGIFKNDTIGFYFPLREAATDPRYGYIKKQNYFADIHGNQNLKFYVGTIPGVFVTNPPDTTVFRELKVFVNKGVKTILIERKEYDY